MAYAPPLYVAQRILATSEDVLRKRLPLGGWPVFLPTAAPSGRGIHALEVLRPTGVTALRRRDGI